MCSLVVSVLDSPAVDPRSNPGSALLTLYDPGGGGFKPPPPLRFFALTHLILELHYCALVTFPKK